MRFLANENFPGTAVRELEAAGHDVAWFRTAAPGASDSEILAWTIRERRVLLTFDKDFGELATKSPLPPGCGVVLFRLPIPRRNQAGRWLAHLVTLRDDWAGHFSVVELGRVRMRPL
jgi:predicted nuclease of predicted toxin-antitoxin system